MDTREKLPSNEITSKDLAGNPESVLDLLREYYQHYQAHPDFYQGSSSHHQQISHNTPDSMEHFENEYRSDHWANCAMIDPSMTHPPITLFQLLINGFGIGIVAMLGIFGNILSAIVLSRPQMKSSVTLLLMGLAFCDTLLISMSILVFSLPFLNDYLQCDFLWKYENIYFRYWVPYLYPIITTAQTGSVYLTLALTTERFIAICDSLRARSICTRGRAKICVAAVLLFSVVYNLPRWWEVLTFPQCEPVRNMTIYLNGKSDMRDNPVYVTVYINWAYLFIMYLAPFSGLVVLNLAIYQQIRKANRERQQLSQSQQREMGLTTMLLCVVVVFLLCNVLPLVNNILESFYDTSVDELVALSNFLVVTNSSVNFVIYCTCGKRFRQQLFQLCSDIFGHPFKSGSMQKHISFQKPSHLRGYDVNGLNNPVPPTISNKPYYYTGKTRTCNTITNTSLPGIHKAYGNLNAGKENPEQPC